MYIVQNAILNRGMWRTESSQFGLFFLYYVMSSVMKNSCYKEAQASDTLGSVVLQGYRKFNSF